MQDFVSATPYPAQPLWFQALAVDALANAHLNPIYWFSVDEVLMLADINNTNVVVFEDFDHGFEYAGSTLASVDDPVAVIALHSHREGMVRSHFQRPLPT